MISNICSCLLALLFLLAGCVPNEKSNSASANASLVTAAAPAVALVGPPLLVSYAADGSPPAEEWVGNFAPPVAGFDPKDSYRHHSFL